MLSGLSRIARIVVPGLPHHVTQRGNRGERVFFEDGDYALYRVPATNRGRRHQVESRATKALSRRTIR